MSAVAPKAFMLISLQLKANIFIIFIGGLDRAWLRDECFPVLYLASTWADKIIILVGWIVLHKHTC
ncbi:hypothetical protein N7488_004807 [Penicillium malachiteum]|nr:hypothetical protein N7488_004807 [Penicillium malachiteum]